MLVDAVAVGCSEVGSAAGLDVVIAGEVVV
jgi:hypothetical protein